MLYVKKGDVVQYKLAIEWVVKIQCTIDDWSSVTRNLYSFIQFHCVQYL